MAISRRNTTAKCLLTRVGCYNIRKQRKGYVNNFFLYLRKKREEGRRLIFDSISCQYGEALCKIRQFLPLVSSNVTLFVLKALNWETNVGYTVNAFFPDSFQKWSRKVFFNIIQESLNVYPEQVKLRIGFWKLLIYSCSTEVEWNMTWQSPGPFCLLTSSMILVLYVPLCCVFDLSLLMISCF